MKQVQQKAGYTTEVWKTVWSMGCIALCALLTLTSAVAAPAPKHRQIMTYDVYAGGFHVVEANLEVDLGKPKRYRLELDAKTRGFLRTLAPWDGTFETTGWYDSRRETPHPEIHRSSAVWRDELEAKEYKYRKDGGFQEYRVTDEYSKNEKRGVEKELTDKTTDVLSATLAVMEKISDGQKCEGTSEVFDGDRRYRMIFRDQGQVNLTATRYNLYEGPATQCVVEVQPVAGKWHKKPRGWMSIQEQGRQHGSLPTVWLAKMSEGEPAVPVKIRVKTDYGTLFMHLTGYQNGTKVLKMKD